MLTDGYSDDDDADSDIEGVKSLLKNKKRIIEDDNDEVSIIKT